MEEGTNNSLIHTPQLEDVTELIHHIQSMLPIKEAARTSVLSKSWLRAWSTIPILRFRQSVMFTSTEKQRQHLQVVDRTLLRYIQDNIPIELIDLDIDIENHELATLAEKWIRQVATKTSLKDVTLVIDVGIASFTLPNEIYLVESLDRISITSIAKSNMKPLWMSSNPMIKCVSLRVLELMGVSISDEVLNRLFSTCSLLEEIELLYCKGLKVIKVRNLLYLCKLRITPDKQNDILEIDNVPNLRLFEYCSRFQRNSLPFNLNSLGYVTTLSLDGVIMNHAFVCMMISKFPLLESLTLDLQYWSSGAFEMICLPLKRLFLYRVKREPRKVQIFAPKLLFFGCYGWSMPSLVFPAGAPEQINVKIDITYPIDDLFFLKIRESLMLSSKFDIGIRVQSKHIVPLNIDIDDLKRGVKFPATNVQQMSFETVADKGLFEHSPFFDAFFTICHPKHVVAIRDVRYKDNYYFCKLMAREVIEKKNRKGYWPDYLKHVEIKNDHNGIWEILTDSWKSFLDGLTQVSWYTVKFKLNWL